MPAKAKRETGRNGYQSQLIKTLRSLFPGCLILKNDASFLQGVPDLLMLWMEHWAAFETKASETAAEQPNQRYYVDLMDSMSFAAFINPGNENEVLDALQRALGSRGAARVSQRQQLSLAKLRRRETTCKVA